jgi:hypothetical protein
VVGCLGDDVVIGESKISKEQVLEIAVITDIVSLLIMLYFINKIEVINAEFLDVYDDCHEKLNDFAI